MHRPRSTYLGLGAGAALRSFSHQPVTSPRKWWGEKNQNEKKNCGKDEPSVNKKSSRKDETNTRGSVTCGSCEDGNVIQVGVIAREFEAEKTEQ